jgi:hypothetical protein
VLLTARGAVLGTALLEQAASWVAAAESDGPGTTTSTEHATQLQNTRNEQVVHIALQSLCKPFMKTCMDIMVAKGVAAKQLQDVLEQQAELLRQLVPLLQAYSSAPSVAQAATQQQQLLLQAASTAGQLQQLRTFAYTIAALLSLPYMCNNLDCCTLAGKSELQLVGGKSCVCKACRAAR